MDLTPELPKSPAEVIDWTPQQAFATGACHYCAEVRPLRTEPFGHVLACRSCWEQVCYGEEG